MGHPMEHVLRQSFLALRLAERLGPATRPSVRSSTTRRCWRGSAATSTPTSRRSGSVTTGRSSTRSAGSIAAGRWRARRSCCATSVPASRWWSGPGSASAFLGEGRRDMDAMLDNHWRAADALTERLGLGQAVRDSVAQTFERWDGKGEPDGRRRRGGAARRRGWSTSPTSSRCSIRPAALEAAVAVARSAQRHAVRPGAGRAVLRPTPPACSTSWSRSRAGRRVMAAEPGLGPPAGRRPSSTPRWRRSPTSST